MRFMAQKTRTAQKAEKSAWQINNQIKKKQWGKAVNHKERNLTQVGKRRRRRKRREGKNRKLGTGDMQRKVITQIKPEVDVRKEG